MVIELPAQCPAVSVEASKPAIYCCFGRTVGGGERLYIVQDTHIVLQQREREGWAVDWKIETFPLG